MTKQYSFVGVCIYNQSTFVFLGLLAGCRVELFWWREIFLLLFVLSLPFFCPYIMRFLYLLETLLRSSHGASLSWAGKDNLIVDEKPNSSKILTWNKMCSNSNYTFVSNIGFDYQYVTW